MNREIKAKWVAALRSGEYKQGTGYLRELAWDGEAEVTAGFCCLGVLCNLHAQAHPRIAAKQEHAGGYLGEDQLLPEKVRKWARLPCKEYGAVVEINGIKEPLTDHNDSFRTFAQIADAIEAQL